MPTLNKLEYLDETKHQIKSALNTNFNTGITDEDTFRSYVDKIKNIYATWPKLTIEGTNFNTLFTKKGKMVLQPKGNTEQDSYSGKNLFDNVYGQTGNVYTTHINANSPLMSVDCYPINLLPNTQYTLKVDMNGYKKTGEWIAGICFENGNIISLLQLNSMADITTTTFTTDNTGVVYVGQRYGFTYGTTGRMDLFLQTTKIQLEPGPTATDYEPYVGGSPSPSPDFPQDIRVVTGDNTIKVSDGTNTDNYSLNLGTIELCKIGEYQDYIYKDSGKWYLHKEIGKVVLDGSENWYTNGTAYQCTFLKNKYVTPNTDIFSNYFVSVAYSGSTFGIALTQSGTTSYGRIVKATEHFSSLNDFKDNWLSTHNTNVYYVLATPTNTVITDTTLINQLEALNNAMAFDGRNNISSECEIGNAPARIKATFMIKGGV